MENNRGLLYSLFTTIKKFRKNSEFRSTIKELRKQTRYLTPVEPFCGGTRLGEQVLNLGNMQYPNKYWIEPKDYWIENVLDCINRKSKQLYSKTSYSKLNNQYYNKSQYFILNNKPYSKDEFTSFNGQAVPNNKIYYIGTYYLGYSEKKAYITIENNEEFITEDKLHNLYQDSEIFSLRASDRNRCFLKILVACLLFHGKYRVRLAANVSVFSITKNMLADCEFKPPVGFEKTLADLLNNRAYEIATRVYLDKRCLVNKMWRELIGCRLTSVNEDSLKLKIKQYFNNLITFAKKEAEYERR